MTDKKQGNDYQEAVRFVSSHVTSRQIINIAFIVGVACLLFVIATLFTLLSAEFWKEMLFNLVKATCVLVTLVFFCKLVYNFTNEKLEEVFKHMPDSDSKNSRTAVKKIVTKTASTKATTKKPTDTTSRRTAVKK